MSLVNNNLFSSELWYSTGIDVLHLHDVLLAQLFLAYTEECEEWRKGSAELCCLWPAASISEEPGSAGIHLSYRGKSIDACLE